MARGTGDVIQEYVVKLGTQIDNEGVNRILSFLDSSKLKALGVAGAIAGITAAVFKLVESTTKREFELEKLAKQQSKTVALVRAENSALRAMGKTIEEINRDEHLKKIYEDVVKFNKELAFPTISDALRQVEGLETAFYKMKSMIGSAVQWIGAQILVNLEAPINRITGKLEKGSTWLRDNMGRVTSKISLFISDFAKGVIGIAEGAGKLLEYFNQLPDAIKAIAAAVAGAVVFLEGGTIGRILTLVTLIGDIMHDYDNYKYNLAHAGEEGFEPVKIGLGDIWEIVDDESLTGEEKGGKIASTILKKITKTLNEAFKDFSMSDIFGDSGDNNGGLIGAITRWFNDESNVDLLKGLGESVYNFIVKAVGVFGGTAGGIAGKILDAIFGSGTTSEDIYKDDGKKGAALAAGIYGYVSGVINHIRQKGFGPGALGAGVGQGLLDSILVAVFENSKNENGAITIDWEGTLGDLSSVGETFLNVIGEAISGVKTAGRIIFSAIGKAIRESSKAIAGDNNAFVALGNAVEGLGNGPLGDAISVGVAAWFTSGSVLGGFAAGLIDLIKYCAEDPETHIPEVVNQMEDFGKKLINFLFGGTGDNGEPQEGVFDTFINLFGQLWEKIEPYLTPLWDGFKAWFRSLFESIIDSIAGAFATVWPKIYNGLPQNIKDFLTNFGIYDPNRSYVTQDETGQWWIETTTGHKEKLKAKDAEIVAGMAPYISDSGIDENGNATWHFTGQYMTWNDNNTDLHLPGYGYMRAGAAVNNFMRNVISDAAGKPHLGWYANDGSFNYVTPEDMLKLMSYASVHGQFGYGDYPRWAAPKEDQFDLRTDEMLRVREVYASTIGGESAKELFAASGVSEQIANFLPRLGEIVRNALGQGIGLDFNGGKNYSYLAGVRGSVVSNISAPVNIYVTATGSDAKEIGTAAYDAAERHLAKTLKEAYK